MLLGICFTVMQRSFLFDRLRSFAGNVRHIGFDGSKYLFALLSHHQGEKGPQLISFWLNDNHEDTIPIQHIANQ